jgi:hypothetical protein
MAKPKSKPKKLKSESEKNPLHKDDEHPAVGWARDAIHELLVFCERAEAGDFDDAYLEAAEHNIESARDEMPDNGDDVDTELGSSEDEA